MTHLEQVLKNLKIDLQDMAFLVQKQLERSKKALLNYDKSLANEVLHTEKRVNAMELKIDQHCENIVALYNPVAKDMRAVFAYYKINSHLERMGDYAKNIANSILDLQKPYELQLLNELKFNRMFEIVNNMIGENITSLMSNLPQSAHSVFQMDIELNELHKTNINLIVNTIKANPENTKDLLELASSVHRLERLGDYNTNIAEELIFCFEALVLKHSEKI